MGRSPLAPIVAAASLLIACGDHGAVTAPIVPQPIAIVRPSAAPNCKPSARCVGWSTLFLSGGRDVDDNAVAHEQNVLFAARSLAAFDLAPPVLLFGDGPNPDADVSYEEPDVARRRRLYAIGLARTPGPEAHEAVLRERSNALPNALPADEDTVLAVLASDAKRAAAAENGPRATDLLFYVTDHGLRARDPSNNVIVLWGAENLTVRDLGQALDAEPPARRVVSVMAQCFSGSFSALVHEGADPAAPIAAHDRCGFFAAPRDRPAAGCSPKTDESLYDDYTTRFFAALAGRDRGGAPVPSADFDGDGHVTFEEAHFATIARDRTMDVPVSTSEELLRRHNPLWLGDILLGKKPIAELLQAARPIIAAAATSVRESLRLDGAITVEELYARAAVEQRACWPGLCEAEDELTEARRLTHLALRGALRDGLPASRPDFAVVKLGTEHVDAAIVAAEPAFDAVLALEARVDALRQTGEDHVARLLRLARLAELAALEARAAREDPTLAAAAARVRACEASGPYAHERETGARPAYTAPAR